MLAVKVLLRFFCASQLNSRAMHSASRRSSRSRSRLD